MPEFVEVLVFVLVLLKFVRRRRGTTVVAFRRHTSYVGASHHSECQSGQEFAVDARLIWIPLIEQGGLQLAGVSLYGKLFSMLFVRREVGA